MCLIYLCPESPRWYMKKNRYAEAWQSMVKLRNHPLQVARDIFYIHSQLELEMQLLRNSTYTQRFVELFTVPRIRRASLAAFTVMIAQQMCGMYVKPVIFYPFDFLTMLGVVFPKRRILLSRYPEQAQND
jgi:hypothetical protein